MIKHVGKKNCDLFFYRNMLFYSLKKQLLNNEARISHIFQVLLWTPAEFTLVCDLQDGH